jgi:carbonic anhydrase/acetyltransferase-like protein (isoleucine patch superfamily)
MGAILLDGVRVGSGSIVAAGSVLLGGFEVPPCSLVAGVPATIKKKLSDAAAQSIASKAEEYHRLALAYLGRVPYVLPKG